MDRKSCLKIYNCKENMINIMYNRTLYVEKRTVTFIMHSQFTLSLTTLCYLKGNELFLNYVVQLKLDSSITYLQ